MSEIFAHVRRASDGDLRDRIKDFLAGSSSSAAAEAGAAVCWCFVEGPLETGFVDAGTVEACVERLWLVRLFDGGRELAARRRGFEEPEPWAVRDIGVVQTTAIGSSPLDERETGHATSEQRGSVEAVRLSPLDEGETLSLLGTCGEDGLFREGGQFAACLAYPRMTTSVGGSVRLKFQRLMPEDGAGVVVRWVSLEAAGGHPS